MFIIMMGVSGCGKTTIGRLAAEKLGIPYYEGDDYHPPANVSKMAAGIPLDDADRDVWLERLAKLIQNKLDEDQSGVLSSSALKQKYRDRLRVDPDQVHFIYLKGSYELILARMAARKDHYMPAKLLQSQFETLEEPQDVFTVQINQTPEEILAEVLDYLRDLGFPGIS